ncbi:DUF1275 family protein [Rhodococcus koreensis]|uniref:DUF1275 domain-containing protein n=1 Tax=Rhodococcus koreensis TaxID=99653 RepID=A0A1H4LVD2_9NOCA|nr:DUF1275 family protein [Rhodococcus koreensis]SEB74790.1 Protein of unknown function [Rhodococcus koreensis]
MSTPDVEMTMRQRGRRAVETAVAMHVGFVDAFGFVLPGGFFVSSIEATTTRAGIALADVMWFVLGLGGAIIAGFLIGVVLAGVVRHRWPGERITPVLLLSAVFLAAVGALTRSPPLHP